MTLAEQPAGKALTLKEVNVMQDRMALYDKVADRLKADYDAVRKANLDTGMKGTAGETVLSRWIQEWLPKRLSIQSGAVISRNEGPTNQMDGLIFDASETPVFRTIGDCDIIPIEGVLCAIEINTGVQTNYSKLLKDAEKLTTVARYSTSRLPHTGLAVSHVLANRRMQELTRDELIRTLLIHRTHDGKPLLVIFAEDIEGTLDEAAKRVMDHNKEAGVMFSVDGLFFLNQGFAHHIDPTGKGWCSRRMQGSLFSCLKASPGEVLLKIQSVILTSLSQAGKTHPASFEAYMARVGQAEREMKAATPVADDAYLRQPDSSTVVRG